MDTCETKLITDWHAFENVIGLVFSVKVITYSVNFSPCNIKFEAGGSVLIEISLG